MATGKSCYGRRSNYRFLSGHMTHSSSTDMSFELNESDIYNSSPEIRRSPTLAGTRKVTSWTKEAEIGGGASSLPVNIPDWSKILKEYRENRSYEYEGGDDDDDLAEEVRVPPHEFLARRRSASFSVQQGIGRTLKGRDLSRVRNAIWEKTGFQD